MNIIALIRRFVPPYKNRMVWNILFNLSSTILSLFSFAAIIPVLYILFGLTSNEVQWVDMQQVHGVEALIDAARNNMYYLLNEQIATRGASVVLLMVGLFLVIMTGIKCGTAWLANYHMVPLRTGVLRDLRKALYDKILSLPIGYFTEARRGDVISRMTNDVNEVEASIMSALDIL
ncbi:MAG: ABC transporter transmembrane domain-containing protein, partial [Paludibacteraceae bacterium]|nr:ABC transporter transmembrane domain-containing protein [Paludibacteraceae bacterium]